MKPVRQKVTFSARVQKRGRSYFFRTFRRERLHRSHGESFFDETKSSRKRLAQEFRLVRRTG